MNDTPPAVTRLRPMRSQNGADTAAMDDIQALLASPDRLPSDLAIEAITEIVQHTGRSLVTPRIFTVAVHDDARGLPYALVDAEGISVRVGQDPDSGGVRVGIQTASDAEYSGLTIHVNGMHIPSGFTQPASDPGTEAQHPSGDGGRS
jgi:hypothetical protein